MDFVSYLKILKPEDWNKQVTSQWTVKDVVAHMIGWEKADPDIIRKTWETKEKPWWLKADNYDEFNQKSVEFYKDYTPEQLIAEWERWQQHVEQEIKKIGEDKLRSRPDLFGWLFEVGERSHYQHHLNQINKVVEKQ